jgi:hypothetical protein
MLKEFEVIRKLGKSHTAFDSSTCWLKQNLKLVLTFVVLGEGSFGTVLLVRRYKDEKLYALKKVSTQISDSEQSFH